MFETVKVKGYTLNQWKVALTDRRIIMLVMFGIGGITFVFCQPLDTFRQMTGVIGLCIMILALLFRIDWKSP
jgi:hypothetical protein